MDAAQQLQPPPNESQAAGEAPAAGAAGEAAAPAIDGEATGAAQSHQQAAAAPIAQPERHLTAVPPPDQGERPEPTRVIRRAQPKAEGEAPARDEKKARGAEAEGSEEGPSKDQIRRYKTRLNKAETAAEKAEAIRYGAERGVPEAIELMSLLRGGAEPAPKQDAQAPVGTAPGAQAAPAQGAQQPEAAEPPKPEGPRYMGQSRDALKRHAEAGAFIGNLAVGIGRMVGWEAPPEPMELFKGIPGFEPIKANGRPQERIAELVTMELAAQSAKGGSEDSPTRRRLELGLLVLCTAGPGVGPFASRLASAGLQKLAQVGGLVSRMVRRVARR